jgi:hypothetical protein
VASAETEREWLALAEELSIRKLKVEVKDALAKNRKRPRAKEDLYSLPAQRLKLPFDFAPEEYELVDQGLRKVAKELSLSLGGEEVDLKEALLYWLKRALETDPASTPEGRIEREESVYTILYHRCRDCHRSHLMTDEGPVDVPAEAVERVERTAETVEIRPEEEVPPAARVEEPAAGAAGVETRDHHHTPDFLRKLFLRDGGRCVNPLCGRKLHLNGHHLKPWSQGGRTALWNEATLCVACHAAVEQGLLKVTGDPLGGFTFTTRADEIGLELAEEGRAIDSLPMVTVQSTYVNGSRPTDQSTYRNGSTQVNQSTQVDGPSTPEEAEVFETCAAALRSLGSRRDSALRATERAFAKLRAAGTPIGEEALIKAALARSPR